MLSSAPRGRPYHSIPLPFIGPVTLQTLGVVLTATFVLLIGAHYALLRESAHLAQLDAAASALAAARASTVALERRLSDETALITALEARVEALRLSQTGASAATGSSDSSSSSSSSSSSDSSSSDSSSKSTAIIPLVVMACDRTDYLRRTLDTVMAVIPPMVSPPSGAAAVFPLFVSQDCRDSPKAAEVEALVAEYGSRVTLLKNDNPERPTSKPGENIKYYFIAQHFKFALTTLFDVYGYDQVLLIEEDLEIAPDFFHYMAAMLPLLRADPSLYCVSAYNDNGKPNVVADPAVVQRTDMFPGLGWMLTRDLWAELGRDDWANGYWDDWLREPTQRKGRACLRPQISRTKTFGAIGTSVGQFFHDHLALIRLNDDSSVDWASYDTAPLEKHAYDSAWDAAVASAKELSFAEFQHLDDDSLDSLAPPAGSASAYKIPYGSTEASYAPIARHFGITSDWKAGIPRTSYRGVVALAYKSVDVYLVGPSYSS